MSVHKNYTVEAKGSAFGDSLKIDTDKFSTIEITTPRGVVVIELFDREPKAPHDSFLTVRCLLGQVEVRPDSGNTIKLRQVIR